MLQAVNVGHKSLADYATIATRGLMDEIRRLAEPLAGKRVAHVSATAFGGGVAEINYTLVPLMQSAGLETDWLIIRGADEFFNVTKTIHNALQGNPQGLDDEQQAIFRRYNEMNAKEFVDDYDFVIVHDAQPAAMIEHFPSSRAQWIWRCHIDLSTPNRQVLDFLLPWIQRYDASIFHRASTCPTTPICERVHLAAGDRPARAEEHGALARGRRVHRRPVRDRRLAAAAHAGLALRPVEGPARA